MVAVTDPFIKLKLLYQQQIICKGNLICIATTQLLILLNKCHLKMSTKIVFNTTEILKTNFNLNLLNCYKLELSYNDNWKNVEQHYCQQTLVSFQILLFYVQ